MLLLATEAGELVRYDPQADTARVLFKVGLKDAFMGIALEGDYLNRTCHPCYSGSYGKRERLTALN